MKTGICIKCGSQLHDDNGVWVDNTGGDVCGANGENDAHTDRLEPFDGGNWTPIEAVSQDGLVMVELDWAGEGWADEYDPENPHDDPLLRFTVYRKFVEGDDQDKQLQICEPDGYEDGDWMAVMDGSYCTQLSARTDRDVLNGKALTILTTVENTCRDFRRDKRLYESLSWIS